MFPNITIARNVMYVNIETIVETVANTVTFQFAKWQTRLLLQYGILCLKPPVQEALHRHFLHDGS